MIPSSLILKSRRCGASLKTSAARMRHCRSPKPHDYHHPADARALNQSSTVRPWLASTNGSRHWKSVSASSKHDAPVPSSTERHVDRALRQLLAETALVEL